MKLSERLTRHKCVVFCGWLVVQGGGHAVEVMKVRGRGI